MCIKKLLNIMIAVFPLRSNICAELKQFQPESVSQRAPVTRSNLNFRFGERRVRIHSLVFIYYCDLLFLNHTDTFVFNCFVEEKGAGTVTECKQSTNKSQRFYVHVSIMRPLRRTNQHYSNTLSVCWKSIHYFFQFVKCFSCGFKYKCLDM